jgi:hypothetical protein
MFLCGKIENHEEDNYSNSGDIHPSIAARTTVL